MNDEIWKYQLPTGTIAVRAVWAPPAFTPLHVDFQGDTPILWARVTPPASKTDMITRVFRRIGTGWTVPAGATYLGTLIEPPNGKFVWHYFLEDAS